MVYFIAECGINHNGNLDIAKELIDTAVAAGCNAVKFQLFYEGEVNGLWEKLKQYHLSSDQLLRLWEHCDDSIDFLCSAFGERSLQELFWLGIDTLKIPSGKLTNKIYMEKARWFFKRFILSTGMSTEEEIDKAISILREVQFCKEPEITILHCVSAYPAPLEEMNLRVLERWKGKYTGYRGCKLGVSDHTKGTLVPILATAMGADVIEKHITLSKSLPGPDHSASLEPAELFACMQTLRDAEKALGKPEKKIVESEKSLLWRKETE